MRNDVWRINDFGANADEGKVIWSPFKSIWNTSMIAIAIIFAPIYFTWSAFVLFLLLSYFTLLFGHSVGMHRRLIHKSYHCPKSFERFLVWLGVLVGMAGPFGILRIHDIRDWAQREETCHDFFAHRRGLWLDAFWQLHCTFAFKHPPKFTIEPEFANDKFYQFMEATWPLYQFIMAGLLYAIGGLSWAVWGVAVRVTVGVSSHWIVTYFAHNPGPGKWFVKNASVQASNLEYWAFLTHGECWHNNHHAFPESARMGVEQGQLDTGWLVLKFLEKCNLVSDLGVPRSHEKRSDLQLFSEVRAQGS